MNPGASGVREGMRLSDLVALAAKSGNPDPEVLLQSGDARYWYLHSLTPDCAVLHEGRLVLASAGANIVGGFPDGTVNLAEQAVPSVETQGDVEKC